MQCMLNSLVKESYLSNRTLPVSSRARQRQFWVLKGFVSQITQCLFVIQKHSEWSTSHCSEGNWGVTMLPSSCFWVRLKMPTWHKACSTCSTNNGATTSHKEWSPEVQAISWLVRFQAFGEHGTVQLSSVIHVHREGVRDQDISQSNQIFESYVWLARKQIAATSLCVYGPQHQHTYTQIGIPIDPMTFLPQWNKTSPGGV